MKVLVIIFISSDLSDFKVTMYWKNCSAESGEDMVMEIRCKLEEMDTDAFNEMDDKSRAKCTI